MLGTTLFGDSRINDAARSGVRLFGGVWLDDCRTCGVGADFFILGGVATRRAGEEFGPMVATRDGSGAETMVPGLKRWFRKRGGYVVQNQ